MDSLAPLLRQRRTVLRALLRKQGELGEAMALYRRALAIYEAKLGSDHTSVAATLNCMADLLREQGELGEAMALYRRAVAINEAKLGADHTSVATTLHNMADLLQEQGELGEAMALYRGEARCGPHICG